jgi:hypothetical protein
MMEWMMLALVIMGFGVSLYSNKFRSKAWLIILVMAWVALFADMLTGTFYYPKMIILLVGLMGIGREFHRLYSLNH